jgi:hypothetical protein
MKVVGQRRHKIAILVRRSRKKVQKHNLRQGWFPGLAIEYIETIYLDRFVPYDDISVRNASRVHVRTASLSVGTLNVPRQIRGSIIIRPDLAFRLSGVVCSPARQAIIERTSIGNAVESHALESARSLVCSGSCVTSNAGPKAAVVKIHGGERCGKVVTMIPTGMVERDERKRTASEASKAD